MSKFNYNTRIDNLKARYNPDKTQLFEDRVYSETYGVVGDTQKYVRMAMMSVDDDYTQRQCKPSVHSAPSYPASSKANCPRTAKQQDSSMTSCTRLNDTCMEGLIKKKTALTFCSTKTGNGIIFA